MGLFSKYSEKNTVSSYTISYRLQSKHNKTQKNNWRRRARKGMLPNMLTTAMLFVFCHRTLCFGPFVLPFYSAFCLLLRKFFAFLFCCVLFTGFCFCCIFWDSNYAFVCLLVSFSILSYLSRIWASRCFAASHKTK